MARQIEQRLQRRFPAPSTCIRTRWWTSPELRLNVDRTRASQLGLTQQAVANSLLVSL